MVGGEAAGDARRAARQRAALRAARTAGFAALGRACPSPGTVALPNTLVQACVPAQRGAQLRAHFERLLRCALPREDWLYVWHRFPYQLWPYVSSSTAADLRFHGMATRPGPRGGISHPHIGAIAAAGFLGPAPWRKAGKETATRLSAAVDPGIGTSGGHPLISQVPADAAPAAEHTPHSARCRPVTSRSPERPRRAVPSVGVSSLTTPTDAPAALAGTGRPASLTVRPWPHRGSWRCSSGQQGEGGRECPVSDGGARGGPVCAAVGSARVFGVSAGSCRLP